jgi:hypothetical protein
MSHSWINAILANKKLAKHHLKNINHNFAGETALTFAVKKNSQVCVRQIIELRPLLLSIPNRGGETPLSIAMNQLNCSMLNIILEHLGKEGSIEVLRTVLAQALKANNLKAAKWCIDQPQIQISLLDSCKQEAKLDLFCKILTSDLLIKLLEPQYHDVYVAVSGTSLNIRMFCLALFMDHKSLVLALAKKWHMLLSPTLLAFINQQRTPLQLTDTCLFAKIKYYSSRPCHCLQIDNHLQMHCFEDLICMAIEMQDVTTFAILTNFSRRSETDGVFGYRRQANCLTVAMESGNLHFLKQLMSSDPYSPFLLQQHTISALYQGIKNNWLIGVQELCRMQPSKIIQADKALTLAASHSGPEMISYILSLNLFHHTMTDAVYEAIRSGNEAALHRLRQSRHFKTQRDLAFYPSHWAALFGQLSMLKTLQEEFPLSQKCMYTPPEGAGEYQ